MAQPSIRILPVWIKELPAVADEHADAAARGWVVPISRLRASQSLSALGLRRAGGQVGRIRASLIRIPHTPSDTSHDRATSSPRGSAVKFDDRRNARLYDLTQPLIINKTPICQAVAERIPASAKDAENRQTGLRYGVVLVALSRPPSTIRLPGARRIRSHDSSLARRLERQPARGSTSSASGCDLRRRDAYEAVWQFQPDVVISAQFLQYIPIQPASGQSAAQLSRLGFLQLCCSKLPADGLLVLFEDVAGETQQETCELGAAWESAGASSSNTASTRSC